MSDDDINWIIPVGTQVVTRINICSKSGDVLFPSGAVGVIVKAPADSTHSYRVLFPDGFETTVRQENLTVRKHYQKNESIGEKNRESNSAFDPYIVYRCIVGSRAYGLEQEGSDSDVRGIYVPPANLHWSLYGIPEQVESANNEAVYWEIRKFLVLALKANPNVLECLYTPLIEYTTPITDELLDLRSIFLSKLIYQTYNGYVLSQFRKLEQDLKNQGVIKWKHAMHLIRLLLSGIIVLKEGFVPLRMEDHRSELLSIRNGAMS